ncbi:DUF1349 domain-containing protein [Sorangium sp. So ce1097]|uniref:DUF1349 domain-containing protein n=1 Tax=Sorangium sp. So ce1097 TaxID=3133330 RepID=UPI003F646E27
MTGMLLDEDFTRQDVDPRLEWRHPPARSVVAPERSVLVVEPAAKTDYWQRTHYGFQNDNGPFLFTRARGDFVMTTHVRFRPAHQYDQAGLMVRLSASCWLKTSVEFEPNGPSRLGAVVTNAGYSDWSTQPFPSDRREIWLRIRREGPDYIVDTSDDGAAWTQLRMAHLHEDDGAREVECGLYACSPIDQGFVAEFELLRIAPGRAG